MSLEQSKKRVFIAIKLYPDPSFKLMIAHLKNKLGNENLRWIPERNMHLTLRFLGEVPGNLVPDISGVLADISVKTRLFPLLLKGLGIFRSLSYPRVLWGGIEAPLELNHLKEEIDRGLMSLGFEFDAQHFHPHLSLARMKKIKDKSLFRELLGDYKDKVLMEQEVESMVFYESVLKEKGPEYFALSEHFFV